MLSLRNHADGKNVLIRGGGFSNKGDQAMGLVTLQQLAIRLKDFDGITNITPNWSVNECWSSGYTPLVLPGGVGKKLLNAAQVALTNPSLLKEFHLSPLSAVEIAHAPSVTAVLDLGGFAYGDTWGIGALNRALAWARSCKNRRIPYIMMPQAWGPFEKPDVREAAKKLISVSSLVYARDKESAKYLREQIQPETDIRQSRDIAFALEGYSPIKGKMLLENNGIDVDGNVIIGISPNMRVYERSAGIGFSNYYVRYLTEIAKYCIAEFGAKVVLIPHEKMGLGKNKPDDMYICSLVETLVNKKNDCVTIGGLSTPELTKSIMNYLDLVISSRFHVAVIALSKAVPVVAVGWAHKYQELLSEFGLGKFNVDLRNQNIDEVKSIVSVIWEQRNAYQNSIIEMLPNILEEVSQVFDDVVSEINGV